MKPMQSYDYVLMLGKRRDLSVRAKWIACVLYHYAGSKGYTNATHDQLAAESQLSKKQVQRAIRDLMAAGILKDYKPGTKALGGMRGKASSFVIGWPSKEDGGRLDTGPGVSRDTFPVPTGIPSKGVLLTETTAQAVSLSQSEEQDKERNIRVQRMEHLREAGLPVEEATLDEWSKVIGESKKNGNTVAATLELLQQEKPRSSQHARAILKLRGFINVY